MWRASPANCPVCKARLGSRNKSVTEIYRCSDCNADVYFYPDGKVKMILATSHKDKGCGCGR